MLIIVMNEVTITEIDFSYRSLLKIFNKQGKEGGKSSEVLKMACGVCGVCRVCEVCEVCEVCLNWR